MRALLPFTGVLQDRNKYLLVSMYHSMLYSFIPARYSLVVTWLHGDFVVWVQGAPNTLDWWTLNFFNHTPRLLFISRCIRYVRVIQWWMLDAVSSKHSLSVLLSAVVMSHTTRTALMLAVDRRHKLIAYMCGVYNSRGYYSKAVFVSLRAPYWVTTIQRLLIVWLVFEGSLLCGHYSKAPYCVATIMWLVFEGSLLCG